MAIKIYNRIMKRKMMVGEMLTRSGPPPLEKDYAVVEAILEARRPAGRVPRAESVNMIEGRDFKLLGIESDSGYVHELEPQGVVEERDVEWVGALQRRYPKGRVNLPEKYRSLSDDQIADKYWSGARSPEPSIEHATRSAKVIAVDDSLTTVRRPSMADAMLKAATNDKDRI